MKKIIDHNGRLFGLISIIDVAVILVIAVSAVALYQKFNVLEMSNPSVTMDEIRYELTVTNMPQGRLDSLKVGDAIYDKDNDTGSPVGTIVDIQATDCTILTTLLDGTYAMVPVEDRYNVTLTIQASGKVDQESGRTYINRTNEIGVGSSINYYTKACLFGAVVTGLG